MLRRIASRLWHLLRSARARRELDAEMSFHLDRLTEDLVREGMDPARARREARHRFGSRERVHARTREERGLGGVDDVLRDLRIALRGMRHSPVFSITFIATLSLCIGLATAAFAVADAVLWRPLPYPEPDRLARAVLYDPEFGKSPANTAVDGRTWLRIRDQADSFERAVYSGAVRGVNLTAEQGAAFVQEQRVGAGYFGTLGIPPLMGREFEASEDRPGGPAVAILSHELWNGMFGRDPDIVGRQIRLKGEAHTVVGVMPATLGPRSEADLWTPLRPSPTGEGSGSNYVVIVRIPEGMSMSEADARIAGIDPYPDGRADSPDRRFGLVPLQEAMTARARVPIFILVGAVGLLLLVGCANLAGLQIARALARRGEMAIRQALGSGTRALVRQVLVENALLGLVGGALGLALAHLAMTPLENVVGARFGVWRELAIDGRVFLGAAGLTAVAGFLFTSAPLLQLSPSRLGRLLGGGSRIAGGRGHGLRRALLVGQVALVTALLFGAGLLVRSYGHLESLDPGFDPEGLLTVQFSLDDARYAEAGQVRRLFEESVSGLRRIPEVTSAAVALTLPYERALNLPFRRPGIEDPRITNAVYVTPGFFQTLRIPVLRGRTLEESDREGTAPVAVANQAFVDRYLEEDAILGTRLELGSGEGTDVAIVGVVGNVQQSAGWGSTTQPVWETPTLYLPAAQASSADLRLVNVWFSPSWIVRAPVASGELGRAVTRVFASLDPDLPVARVALLEEVMEQAFSLPRFGAALLSGVALFALLLAGIGLYGIVAYEVVERRREMGLRMALGATPRGAAWTAGASGIRLALAGLVIGGVATFGVSRLVRYVVWGVAPYDPVTLVSLVLVLGSVAAAASFVPAARVGRMDPARVLAEP